MDDAVGDATEDALTLFVGTLPGDDLQDTHAEGVLTGKGKCAAVS